MKKLLYRPRFTIE